MAFFRWVTILCFVGLNSCSSTDTQEPMSKDIPDARAFDDAAMIRDARVMTIDASDILDAGEDFQDAAMMRPNETYSGARFDGEVVYMTRYSGGQNMSRTVKYRVHYPLEFEGRAPVIIVSHGGSGSNRGFTTFTHLAQEYVSEGYVSVHLNHNGSNNIFYHRVDRPRDVSAIIENLPTIASMLPAQFLGALDLERIAHIGHSWGAYTAHAVAGADFVNPTGNGGLTWNFRDERVKAFAALSPQGFGGMGSFDVAQDITNTSTANSWMNIDVPAFGLIGEAEMDGVVGVENLQNCPDCFRATDWRLFPFERYPSDGTKFVAVLPNATHLDLGNGGSNAIKNYIAKNTRLFFDVYLKGYAERKSQIGQVDGVAGIVFRAK